MGTHSQIKIQLVIISCADSFIFLGSISTQFDFLNEKIQGNSTLVETAIKYGMCLLSLEYWQHIWELYRTLRRESTACAPH